MINLKSKWLPLYFDRTDPREDFLAEFNGNNRIKCKITVLLLSVFFVIIVVVIGNINENEKEIHNKLR